jgi:hypothetical protein
MPTFRDLMEHNYSGTYAGLNAESDRGGDLSSAKMYVHIRRSPNDLLFVDIQYWFFYPYNGAVPIQPWKGNHEGDWEHITVRVSNWWQGLNQLAVDGIFFAAHGYEEGRWITKCSDSPEKGHYSYVPGTRHPIVYSAYNTHASYESPGIHWRELFWYFLQDYTSDGGPAWGLAKGTAQLMALAPDLLVTGQAFVEPPWVQFKGRWGYDGTETPTFQLQTPWNDDGNNVFYGHSLEPFADIGNDWSPQRYATAIAFGKLNGEDVVGVTRDRGDGSYFCIYRYDQQLTYMAVGGQDWPATRTAATSIAFGNLNNRDVVVVGTAGDKGYYGCYGWDPQGKLDTLFQEEIGESVKATSVAFGLLDGGPAIGIATSADGYGIFRVKLYDQDGTEKATIDGESEWYGGISSIAFGDLHGEVVGVTRRGLDRDGPRDAAFIYQYNSRSERLMLIATDLGLWGQQDPIWGATHIEFGILNNEPVVVIVRLGNAAGAKFIVCRYLKEEGQRIGRLEVMSSGWAEPNIFASGASFGNVNGQNILSIYGVNWPSKCISTPNPVLYIYDEGLSKYYEVQDPSKTSRGGASTAFGSLGKQPVFGVAFSGLTDIGSNINAKPKAQILKWRHPG